MGSAQEQLRQRSNFFRREAHPRSGCAFFVRDSASGEDDGLIRVGEDAVAEVPAHGAGENQAFEVAALLNQVGELVVLRDAGDVLLDDGAFVEDFGDVMAGGADQLDSACKGSVVGAGSGEGGEK
jgi:hypothetical protein